MKRNYANFVKGRIECYTYRFLSEGKLTYDHSIEVRKALNNAFKKYYHDRKKEFNQGHGDRKAKEHDLYHEMTNEEYWEKFARPYFKKALALLQKYLAEDSGKEIDARNKLKFERIRLGNFERIRLGNFERL